MQTNVRVAGSGFTVLKYDKVPIAYLQKFTDSGQKPFGGPGFEQIFSLGDHYPSEIATGRVLGAGTITAEIKELWNGHVWAKLGADSGAGDFGGIDNILGIWRALAQRPNDVTCQMAVKRAGVNLRYKNYFGCVVTSVDDGETVEIGSLSVTKNIIITYTKATWDQNTNRDEEETR